MNNSRIECRRDLVEEILIYGSLDIRDFELSLFIHSVSSLCYDRSKASPKASSPHSAI